MQPIKDERILSAVNLVASCTGLMNGTNIELIEENSNKSAGIISTQRDLLAGELSKFLTEETGLLPPWVLIAEKNGVLHVNDLDYYFQPMHNCGVYNYRDMMMNGTIINGKQINSPSSFRTACTIITQIMAQIASSSFGGQSININVLSPFLERSERKLELLAEEYEIWDKDKYVARELQKELKQGIQTLNYQINTLMTGNGQSPFVTICLILDEEDEYLKYTVMIIEEILRQRLEGMPNEKGVCTTPAFPKLIYYIDECNIHGEYSWLTDLAVECSNKRSYPDYVSCKKMKEIYNGEIFPIMGCRALLSPYKENGKYLWEGRFNQGVTTLNLPQIGILSNGNIETFWKLFESRCELVHETLKLRHNKLLGTLSDVAPILWQNGAIARLEPGQKIDELLKNGYSTITFGYVGIAEMCYSMFGKTHYDSKIAKKFALDVMKRMKELCLKWTKEDGIGYALYGSPSEKTAGRLRNIDYKLYGEIEGVTDHEWYTNSYHIPVDKEVTAFDKFTFESEFQAISSGGAISYCEINNLNNNLPALKALVEHMYDTILYASVNNKSDYCYECGFEGEIKLDENANWVCPVCGNKDTSKMEVIRTICGYLTSNEINESKRWEMKNRYIHL